MTAVVLSGFSPSIRAASAVEGAAKLTAAGTFAARNFRHWARAWGNERTFLMSDSWVPSFAIRAR
jgi:hypothetical protein